VITLIWVIVAIAGFSALMGACAQYGPGVHVVDGVTLTCG
jgi:hypothetical protein